MTNTIASRLHRIAMLAALCIALASTGSALTATSAVAKPAPAATKGKKAAAAKKQLAGTLNLNTATSAQLQLLPGIGPKKAERVVEFRTRKGKFNRVADLRRVKGFGKKSVDKLAPYLRTKGETTLRYE